MFIAKNILYVEMVGHFNFALKNISNVLIYDEIGVTVNTILLKNINTHFIIINI